MITFSIILVILAIVSLISILGVAAGGLTFLLTFGDVIVGVAIIVWLIKKIVNKKK